MKKGKKVKINCQKGGLFEQGYKDNSPYKHLPEITIPGDRITMKGVSKPLKAELSNGQTHLMQPGQEYYFPGTEYVKESPYYQLGGPIVQKSISPNWYQVPKPPVQTKVPFTTNHEGVNKMKSKDKIYEKQEGGQMQFDQQVLGSYVRSLAPREQSQFIEQWEQMDEAQKQELYQAIMQQAQGQPEMQEGGFVHPYDSDFYPEMQSGGAPIWNNLNATAYAKDYRPKTVDQAPVVTQTAQTIPVAVAQQIVKQGSDVTRIQQALVDAGYKIKVDGVYGPKTQKAVENFQRDNFGDKEADGVAGFNTLGALGLQDLQMASKKFKNSITKKAPVIKATEVETPQEQQNSSAEEISEMNYYTPVTPSKPMSDWERAMTAKQQYQNSLQAYQDSKPMYSPFYNESNIPVAPSKNIVAQSKANYQPVVSDNTQGLPAYFENDAPTQISSDEVSVGRGIYKGFKLYSEDANTYTLSNAQGRILKIDKKTGQPIK